MAKYKVKEDYAPGVYGDATVWVVVNTARPDKAIKAFRPNGNYNLNGYCTDDHSEAVKVCRKMNSK